MPIFKQNQKKLDPIKEVKIDLEKDIQVITESNLETVFNLQFICSEFSLNNLRIDTLAFDPESKAFVIIEYKKDRSFSVIDQGYAYLALMLNHKADFILEYNEHLKNGLKRDDVDWSQSRVIFIANSFTKYQQEAINFQDLPIELWEVKKYSNSTLLYNQLQSPQASESIKTISKNKTINKVSQEVKKYSINDHFKSDWEHSRELFEIIREKILSLKDTGENITKNYIAYKLKKNSQLYNFVEVVGQANNLKIYLDIKINDIEDNKKMVKDCSKVGRWATGNVYFKLEEEVDIDYAMFLIKQVYEKFYKE